MEKYLRMSKKAVTLQRKLPNKVPYECKYHQSFYHYGLCRHQLPEKQSLVLRAIAKEGNAQNLTSGKFIKRHGLLSASSVKSAVPALLDKGLITSEKGVYQVYDKFLELWLRL